MQPSWPHVLSKIHQWYMFTRLGKDLPTILHKFREPCSYHHGYYVTLFQRGNGIEWIICFVYLVSFSLREHRGTARNCLLWTNSYPEFAMRLDIGLWVRDSLRGNRMSWKRFYSFCFWRNSSTPPTCLLEQKKSPKRSKQPWCGIQGHQGTASVKI